MNPSFDLPTLTCLIRNHVSLNPQNCPVVCKILSVLDCDGGLILNIPKTNGRKAS